jgi:hypothetical protein
MNDLQTATNDLLRRSETLLITNDEEFQAGGRLLHSIKDFEREIDDSFDPVIKSAHKAHKDALAAKAKHLSPLTQAKSNIRLEMGRYHAEIEERKRQERARLEEIARKEAEEIRLAQAVEMEQNGHVDEANDMLDEELIVPVPQVDPGPKVEGMSFRDSWDFEIVDSGLIPRCYLVPDEKSIRAVVQALKEKTDIPGIKVFKKTITVVR